MRQFRGIASAFLLTGETGACWHGGHSAKARSRKAWTSHHRRFDRCFGTHFMIVINAYRFLQSRPSEAFSAQAEENWTSLEDQELIPATSCQVLKERVSCCSHSVTA